MLRVHVQHRVGALSLDVAFDARASWTVLFGPSGSGKTTVLRAISGFLRPENGYVAIEGAETDRTVLFDRATGVMRPPHQRPIRTAAQRAALFPRRTVLQNLGYGAGNRDDLVQDTLDRLRLRALAASRVERLSGGEQQRVAVARAISSARAAGPGTWLLLDEPFTGLDLARRADLIDDLRDWLPKLGHPVLSVTHDAAEVFALEAEVVRLGEGRVLSTGSPETTLTAERDRLMGELHAGRSQGA